MILFYCSPSSHYHISCTRGWLFSTTGARRQVSWMAILARSKRAWTLAHLLPSRIHTIKIEWGKWIPWVARQVRLLASGNLFCSVLSIQHSMKLKGVLECCSGCFLKCFFFGNHQNNFFYFLKIIFEISMKTSKNN